MVPVVESHTRTARIRPPDHCIAMRPPATFFTPSPVTFSDPSRSQDSAGAGGSRRSAPRPPPADSAACGKPRRFPGDESLLVGGYHPHPHRRSGRTDLPLGRAPVIFARIQHHARVL